MICFYKQIIIPYCKEKDIRPYILNYPSYLDIENLSTEEKTLVSVMPNNIAENRVYYKDLYSDVNEFCEEYIHEVFTLSPIIKKGERYVHSDIKSKYVNIIQNIRYTCYMPDSFNHTIYLVGHCDVLGYGVDDSRTISSYLQKLLNPDRSVEAQYRVLNYGVLGRNTNELVKIYETLKSISFSSGDIVVIISEKYFGKKQNDFTYHKKILNNSYQLFYNMHTEFNEPRPIPLMIDYHHLSYAGMLRVAKTLYKILLNDGLINIYDQLSANKTINSYNTKNLIALNEFVTKNNDDLNAYLESLKKYTRNNSGNAGAIVMNCNPFTKGHRYLIENTANIVANLYIFVVEENKSMFSFADRFQLIEKGVIDLKNVKVLPSGKFILSSITFPEYFTKESINNIIVDTSLDIDIFAKYIAPTLNIIYRFVGEEPYDPITKQYNNTMKEMLPKYGITVIEIPRVQTSDGNPISASRVRSLIRDGNLSKIQEIVPSTTYNYIASKFFHHNLLKYSK